MANYFDQFDEPPAAPQSAPAASANYFDQFDEKPAAPPAQPGWMDYVFRGAPVNAILGMGDAVRSTNPNTFPADPLMGATTMMPRQQFNQNTYGTPEIQPPSNPSWMPDWVGNTAKKAGAVTSAFAADPAMSIMAPGYTVAGTLGSELASDYKPSWMPDWAARLIGGSAGGGLYGGLVRAPIGAAYDATIGAKSPLDIAAETRSAIESGQGLHGQFQKQAEAAARSLSEDANPRPNVAPTAPIKMDRTVGILSEPNLQLPTGGAELRDILNRSGQTLPYKDIKPWLDDLGGSGPLARAMRDDLNEGIGPDAAKQLTAANRAAQGRFILENARDPDGFYNPAKLTKGLLKSPNGEEISNITPEVSDLTDQAGKITDLQSKWAQANMPAPSSIGPLARKAALAASAAAAGKIFGEPEIGMAGAGFLLGHPEQQATRLNQILYGIPKPLPLGIPRRGLSGMATLPGILGSADTP